MHRTVGQPEILWDDISFHYAREIYDEIYRIENLMRKLITNFMLVTVGAGWVDESSPKEIKDVIDRSKRKESLNVLHQVDFIHLADFLLRPYSTATQDELNDLLRKAETVDDLRAAQDLLPQSNWNRYFSEIVDCGDAYLNTRWKELYELRCRVAHNAIVNKDDRDRAVKLVSELAGKVEDAIRKLPQVRVPQSEVEQIAENAATTRDERVQAVLAALDDANRRKAAREAIRSAAVRLFSASRVDDDASSAFVRTPLSDSLLDLFDEGLNRGSLHVPNLELFKQHDDREGSKQQDGDDND